MKNLVNIFFLVLLFSTVTKTQHIELGNVQWMRNYDNAVLKAKKSGKDILVLFQEVPGCSTCRKYGTDVLSKPLLVEAIETYFVPLAIFNNHKGHDAEILRKFKEPSWNNPVVRIINKNGNDLVDRLAGQYSSQSLIWTIIKALEAKSVIVPNYLQLLANEEEISEELILGMYCFWTGEKVIGNMNGVTSTEAGFMSGNEVVKLKFNPNLTDEKTIINAARKQSCADTVFSNKPEDYPIKTKAIGTYRKDKEDKYYLIHSKYKSLHLTTAQATKVNSYLGQGLNPDEWLSPRQLLTLK